MIYALIQKLCIQKRQKHSTPESLIASSSNNHRIKQVTHCFLSHAKSGVEETFPSMRRSQYTQYIHKEPLKNFLYHFGNGPYNHLLCPRHYPFLGRHPQRKQCCDMFVQHHLFLQCLGDSEGEAEGMKNS